jgi:hypothetical protein
MREIYSPQIRLDSRHPTRQVVGTRVADRGGWTTTRTLALWRRCPCDRLDAEDVSWRRLPVPPAQRCRRRRQPSTLDPADALLRRGRHPARPLARISAQSARARRTPAGRGGPRVTVGTADRPRTRPDHWRPARPCVSGVPGRGSPYRRPHRANPRRRLRRGPRRRDRAHRGGGGRRQQPSPGRRLRLHLQRAEVGLRSLGRR